MAQIPDIKTNLIKNNDCWRDVAVAIDYCGGHAVNEPVDTYGDEIRSFKNDIDTGKNAQSIISGLEDTIAEDNSNFNDIRTSIITKGVTPAGGHDTYAQAILEISGGGTTIVNQDKTITPTTEQQVITHDSGYTGLGNVTVKAVDKNIDSNIVATNIKKNVNILGVIGTLEEGTEPVLQEKSINPSTSQQNITPDSGFDGLSKVVVNAMRLQDKTVDANKTGVTVNCDSNYDGLDTVYIRPVDSSIDSNIKPENILKDIQILGITGTLESGGGTSKWKKLTLPSELPNDGLSYFFIYTYGSNAGEIKLAKFNLGRFGYIERNGTGVFVDRLNGSINIYTKSNSNTWVLQSTQTNTIIADVKDCYATNSDTYTTMPVIQTVSDYSELL